MDVIQHELDDIRNEWSVHNQAVKPSRSPRGNQIFCILHLNKQVGLAVIISDTVVISNNFYIQTVY